MKTTIFIILITCLLCSCSSSNESQSERLVPLGFNFDSTKYDHYIIVISDVLDTSSINSSIRLEKLNIDINYSVYNTPDFFKVIKFQNPFPYYLYFAIMGETSMSNPRTKDCFALALNKTEKNYSFVLRNSKPNFLYHDRDFYYGKFFDQKPFIVNYWAAVDTCINKCAYKYDKSPFTENCLTYIDKNEFKLKFLDNISNLTPSYTVCVLSAK